MHGQESSNLVLYGKLYITRIRASYTCIVYVHRIRASYTWPYVKRNILLRFYGISHACANSGAQAVFSLPRKKRPGDEANGTLASFPGRFCGGEEKRPGQWAPLLAHARRSHKNMGIRARLCIVRLHISNLP